MAKYIREEPQPALDNQLTENSLFILKQRYLRRNKKGEVTETPDEMFHRVAQVVAGAELFYSPGADIGAWENKFYKLMANLEFLPNSPTLLNAGREQGQLSACFILPVNDSPESISDAINNAATIHKSGGGTGFSFSSIRPKGDTATSKAKITGDLVSLLHSFSTAIGAVKQGGIRQGCNMAVLSVNHPDIIKFIVAKDNPDVLTNFYLSVAVTTEFMEAVKTASEYNLINPLTQQAVGKLNAKYVFDRIVEQTWKTGDPGIVFIDRIERDNPTPRLGKIEGVCGCGEQVLLPYESSNLGSINLARMIRMRNGITEIDYPRLSDTVKTTARFLDNVIDVNRFPLSETEEVIKKTRKIGLGVMGFADMLIRLGIPYDSEKAVEVAAEVMQFINNEAYRTSSVLAEERGAFPAFKDSIYNILGSPPLRNASRTTIAPTGTLSIIAGCSSGIEPAFAIVFVRNLFGGGCLLEVNPYFEEAAKKGGFYSDELMKSLACGNRLSTLKDVPRKIKRIFVTALEVKPEWHIRIQSAFQKSTDSAVSKTINLPETDTLEDIAKIYMLAYGEGLKGITIYRNNSRKLQPLANSKAGLELMCQRLSV
ncbi:MAG: adenosylcobalamin-dependent ribonucleoside-diphosphate reductase [Chloroflexota bacterium]